MNTEEKLAVLEKFVTNEFKEQLSVIIQLIDMIDELQQKVEFIEKVAVVDEDIVRQEKSKERIGVFQTFNDNFKGRTVRTSKELQKIL